MSSHAVGLMAVLPQPQAEVGINCRVPLQTAGAGLMAGPACCLHERAHDQSYRLLCKTRIACILLCILSLMGLVHAGMVTMQEMWGAVHV